MASSSARGGGGQSRKTEALVVVFCVCGAVSVVGELGRPVIYRGRRPEK